MTASLVATLQAAVARENQVVAAYGAAGAHLAPAHEGQAATDRHLHLLRRDAYAALLHAAGGNAPAQPPAYRLPVLATAGAAATYAVHLEDSACSTAAAVVAAAPAGSPARQLAVTALVESARLAAAWRVVTGTTASAPALPGRH